MKISADQVDIRQLAGESGDGHPVIYVSTKGGLHAFFTKGGDGNISTLSAAPHRAIASWMAEKKDPKLKWKESFINKTETTLEKAEQERFIRLRQTIFAPCELIKSTEWNELWLVYDTERSQFHVEDEEGLAEGISKGEYGPYMLIRNMSLKEPVSTVAQHGKFKGYLRK